MTQRSFHAGLGAALLVLSVRASVPLVVQAETSDSDALRDEVKDLKQVIQRLNERVNGLEKQLTPRSEPSAQGLAAPETPAPQPSPSATPTASPPDHWRKVRHGMTAQDVEALLGRPQRTMKVGLKMVWYYTYAEIGSGSVVFAENGCVDDWQTPPFNAWFNTWW